MSGAPELKNEDDFEITPEMLEAGAALLHDYYDEPTDWLTRDRARELFEAMIFLKDA